MLLYPVWLNCILWLNLLGYYERLRPPRILKRDLLCHNEQRKMLDFSIEILSQQDETIHSEDSMPKQFDSKTLNQLASTKEIKIETHSATGQTHRTIIWVMVDDQNVYIRSWLGLKGRWYQEIKANPNAAILLNGQRLPVRALPVTDEATITRVSDNILSKYHNSSSAKSMLREEILSTTLLLEPA